LKTKLEKTMKPYETRDISMMRCDIRQPTTLNNATNHMLAIVDSGAAQQLV